MRAAFLQDADCTLFQGDALEVLRELPDASVHAVVTSPEYADARPEWRESLLTYGDVLSEILEELLRVVTPTGSLMLNLGRIFRDGEERDYWIDILGRARKKGWRWIDSLVWYKPNAPARSGPYLTNAHEHVFWLGRQTDAYRGLDDARTPYAASTLARYGRNWARNTRVKGSHVDQNRAGSASARGEAFIGNR